MAPTTAPGASTHPPEAGEIVYLLVELGGSSRATVHEIGSRARVLSRENSRLTLAVGEGMSIDVVSCFASQVRSARAGATRRRPTSWRRPRQLISVS